MKILVLLNDLDIGGAQNYTISLMNEFVKLGHSINLRVLSENILLKNRLNSDIDVQTWIRKHKFDLRVLKRIRQEITTGNYDGVISSYPLYNKIACLGLIKKPITLYPVHSTVDPDVKSFLINFLMFRLKSKNEIYVTSIDNQTSYLRKRHFLSSRYFIQIFNGIDTAKFATIPEGFSRKKFLCELGVPENNKIILMVAGYREEKRHVDALNSFKLLRENMKNVTLICVGDNRIENRDNLQKYISKNNIEDVKLLIASEAGDVKKYYWSADIFTLTSNKVETFPISVLEAMACGIPCIITETGGAKDIIKHQKLGKVVPVENIKAIAYAWKQVLLNQHSSDKEFIKNYVQENFKLKTSAEQYINLINSTHVN